jgi:hypothetical protein
MDIKLLFSTIVHRYLSLNINIYLRPNMGGIYPDHNSIFMFNYCIYEK